jgi:hypothetical protein
LNLAFVDAQGGGNFDHALSISGGAGPRAELESRGMYSVLY